jgi:hypothetical protein
MATLKNTATSEAPVKTGIDPVGDGIETLHTKLTHLRALLLVTYGAGGDTFRTYSDDIQDTYLWACADMADECVNRLNALREGGAA